MARPWSRKRSDDTPEPGATPGEPVDTVHLDDEDHAWWAQGEVEQAWTPRAHKPAEREEQRDILGEHFGEDWRTSFGFTPPTAEELAAEAAREQQAIDSKDPYAVLQVDPTASWSEIVAAHRYQARSHHPDQLFGQSDEDKAASEDRIRVINAAYQELRVRRGM